LNQQFQTIKPANKLNWESHLLSLVFGVHKFKCPPLVLLIYCSYFT